ncbi:MAG: MMPL family transporter [Actinomycetota bacterium]
MSARLANLIARRPRTALVVLAAALGVLAVGIGLLDDQADDSAFLPPDSDVALADDALAESFPDSAGLVNVTILHRGDALTPEGLAHIDEVMDTVIAEPDVADRLATVDPAISLADVFSQALGVDDLSTVSQEQIDAAAANPQVAAAVEALNGEADGEELTVSGLRLRELGDEDGLVETELRVSEVVEDVDGPLEVRSLSPATRDAESEDAINSSMQTLIAISIVVIALLLALFFKTGSDVALSLLGLGITVAGTLGFQGLMGPNGLDIIGPPNRITTMVPIMLIGLVVDYAIQSVGRYRELRADGEGVTPAVVGGLRGVMLPLCLAGGTTMISFLTNLTSPLPANQDFGVVAAFGVGFGLFTMLTLMPAARLLLDERRAATGKLGPVKTMTDAVPGGGAFASRVGSYTARSPMTVLFVAGALTIGLGIAATGISTEFDPDDFLPSDADGVVDRDALGAVGGQTQVATILVEAELTDDRTLRNLLTFDEAFADELSRPTGAAGPITLSLGMLFEDWIDDSGEPGDRYDAELASMTEGLVTDTFAERTLVDPADLQAIIDRLESVDPDGFAQVAVSDPEGVDRTIMQFNAFSADLDTTADMLDGIEGLWYGDDEEVSTTSGDITGLEVTNAMTDSQTTAIATTIVAALIVLMFFFWFTEFKPMLAVIAVLPVMLVLIWVLGTMALLGIPYNVVTALITALSIGIGVDYTIHVIHRFTEEVHEGKSIVEATRTTLATTGSALIGSALTTALAFAVLMLSPLVPFQQFGLVTGVTILYALVVSVLVVPPMLVLWAAYHQWRQSADAVIDRQPEDDVTEELVGSST